MARVVAVGSREQPRYLSYPLSTAREVGMKSISLSLVPTLAGQF